MIFFRNRFCNFANVKKKQQKKKKETKVVANASLRYLWSEARSERNRKIVRNVPLDIDRNIEKERLQALRNIAQSYNGTWELYACNHDWCNGKIRNYERSCSSKLIISTMYETVSLFCLSDTNAQSSMTRPSFYRATFIALRFSNIYVWNPCCKTHRSSSTLFTDGKTWQTISHKSHFSYIAFFHFLIDRVGVKIINSRFNIVLLFFFSSPSHPLGNWLILESISLLHFVFSKFESFTVFIFSLTNVDLFV